MNLELKSKIITQPYQLLSNHFLSCYFLLPAQIRGDTGHKLAQQNVFLFVEARRFAFCSQNQVMYSETHNGRLP